MELREVVEHRNELNKSRPADKWLEVILWRADLYDAAIRASKETFDGLYPDEMFWAFNPQLWEIGDDDRRAPYYDGADEKWYSPLGWIVEPDSTQRSVAVLFVVCEVAVQPDIRPVTSAPKTWIYTKNYKLEKLVEYSESRLITSSEEVGFYAAMSFLRLPFVGLRREKLNRAARRQMARQNILETDVQVVCLRHRESRKGNGQSWKLTDSIIVRGHWRRQYHSKEGVHKPIYIMPYLKGPEDAPLKARPDVIFKVTR